MHSEISNVMKTKFIKSLVVLSAIFAILVATTVRMNAQTIPDMVTEVVDDSLGETDEATSDEKDVAVSIQSRMPSEEEPHEGTWLQWVHQYTYGRAYRDSVDPTWVAMTRALVQSEKVHIIAYDSREVKRIKNLLTRGGVSLQNVDFLIRRTDDVWVRDNGPIFVYDNNNELKITDWDFNGWGLDTPYRSDNTVPNGVSSYLDLPKVDLNNITLEGGAIEVDGQGVLMATRSSTIQNGRNENMTQAQFENALTTNLGVTKFIWLNGYFGGQEDITDAHIDGFARFAHNNTIVTMNNANLQYWGLSTADRNTLNSATNVNGVSYSFVRLPLTANNVRTTDGRNLGFKGSYVNYYSANTVVLMPTYNDPNDSAALSQLQQLYPNKTVIGIDVRNLYENGGMVHCVTQQQPIELNAVKVEN